MKITVKENKVTLTPIYKRATITTVGIQGPPGPDPFQIKGVYVAGTTYNKRDLVYYQGNTYYATQTTNTTPNMVSANWTVISIGNQANMISTTDPAKTVQDRLDEIVGKVTTNNAAVYAGISVFKDAVTKTASIFFPPVGTGNDPAYIQHVESVVDSSEMRISVSDNLFNGGAIGDSLIIGSAPGNIWQGAYKFKDKLFFADLNTGTYDNTNLFRYDVNTLKSDGNFISGGTITGNTVASTTANITTANINATVTSTLNVGSTANFADVIILRYVPTYATSVGNGQIGVPRFNPALTSNPLHTDLTFANGFNGVVVYNNNSNGAVVITRDLAINYGMKTANKSGYILKIVYNPASGLPNPGLGGWYQDTMSRPNAVFVHKFRANLPIGYYFTQASNALGAEVNVHWSTPMVGTGKWEDYSYTTTCGNSGTFSTLGFVFVTGVSNVTLTWYLESGCVYDTSTTGISELLTNGGTIAKNLTVTGTIATPVDVSVTADGQGIALFGGARVFKKFGSGLTIKTHSDATPIAFRDSLDSIDTLSIASNSPTNYAGLVYLGKKVFNEGFMGTGSGLSADTFQGTAYSDFIRKSDISSYTQAGSIYNNQPLANANGFDFFRTYHGMQIGQYCAGNADSYIRLLPGYSNNPKINFTQNGTNFAVNHGQLGYGEGPAAVDLVLKNTIGRILIDNSAAAGVATGNSLQLKAAKDLLFVSMDDALGTIKYLSSAITNGIFIRPAMNSIDANNGTLLLQSQSGAAFGMSIGNAGNTSCKLNVGGTANITGNTFIGSTYGGQSNIAPVITLAVGDHDTGLTWGGDGKINFISNNAIVGFWNPAGVTTSSSRTLKENITDYTDSALAIVNTIQMVNYNFIADPGKTSKVGFIAEDTDKLLAGPDHDGMDISNTLGLLLKAVQELSDRVVYLENELTKV